MTSQQVASPVAHGPEEAALRLELSRLLSGDDADDNSQQPEQLTPSPKLTISEDLKTRCSKPLPPLPSMAVDRNDTSPNPEKSPKSPKSNWQKLFRLSARNRSPPSSSPSTSPPPTPCFHGLTDCVTCARLDLAYGDDSELWIRAHNQEIFQRHQEAMAEEAAEAAAALAKEENRLRKQLRRAKSGLDDAAISAW